MWDLTRPVDEVAPTLLGAVLRHGPVAVRLTEVDGADGVLLRRSREAG